MIRPVILSISQDGSRIEAVIGSHATAVNSRVELDQFLSRIALHQGVPPADLIVACSSTLDFPSDFTKDPAVLALAKEIVQMTEDPEDLGHV